jgi:hypothetical protein
MNENTKLNDLMALVFRAVALAMAIAAIVLNVLGKVSTETVVIFLSIGLFSLAISSFSQQKDAKND